MIRLPAMEGVYDFAFCSGRAAALVLPRRTRSRRRRAVRRRLSIAARDFSPFRADMYASRSDCITAAAGGRACPTSAIMSRTSTLLQIHIRFANLALVLQIEQHRAPFSCAAATAHALSMRRQ